MNYYELPDNCLVATYISTITNSVFHDKTMGEIRAEEKAYQKRFFEKLNESCSLKVYPNIENYSMGADIASTITGTYVYSPNDVSFIALPPATNSNVNQDDFKPNSNSTDWLKTWMDFYTAEQVEIKDNANALHYEGAWPPPNKKRIPT